MQSTISSISPEEETNELKRFRQEWLAELRSRKAAASAGASGTSTIRNDAEEVNSPHQSSSKAAAEAPGIPGALPHAIGPSSQVIAGSYTPSIYLAATSLPQKLGSALNVYRRAVEREQSGDLDDALLLYRQAFRMDPHVDQVYHREEALASIEAAQQNTLQKSTASAVHDSIKELTAKVQTSLSVKSRAGASAVRVTSQVLASILAGFPNDLSFEPENEEEPVHLQMVPEELLIMFLRKLDTTSIERFASVCRKARVIALDSVIWRELVGATYIPPQITRDEDLTSVLERYLYDYRRVYIEHPRVRLDGVYIATCHYVRPGLSENSWVTINHLITYHRYLRFYPSGQVLSLLANEEFTPQQVIPLLKPTLRMKGFYIGTWSITDTTIQITNLLDASGRYPLPTDNLPTSSVNNSDGSEANRYTFVMTLDLVSRPLGRWNKMNILAYNSVHLGTGDVNPVALKNERPFWFSRVRSYSVY
ncbi:F-box only protein 9 [Termitomyces sp. T112]|nr:F-box only protein 9 [Termitomyces sp. T112]